MSYTQQKDGTIIINGFEKGVSDSPYTGLADMRNVNLISIPGEASVGFKTSSLTPLGQTLSVTSTNTGTDTITFTGGSVESGEAIQFSVVNFTSTPAITIGKTYWLGNSAGTSGKIYSDYSLSTLVDITSNNTATFATLTMNYPKYYAYDKINDKYWLVDANGQVWSNAKTTTGSSYWTYTGNDGISDSNFRIGKNGNGLGYYQGSDGIGWMFVFRNGAIDYTPSTPNGTGWVYGWKPSDASTGNANSALKTAGGTTNSHETLLAPDNAFYFCDANYIGRFFQTSASGTAFAPTTISSYTFDETPLLPFNDTANCMAFLGTNIMVGGIKNVIYPWDTTSPTYNYPLMIAESLISKMLTINTNTFILAGNRGRIYVTNGSQAGLYKKLPDHISGTVEPYFKWGGIASTKNQLYFSASCTNNGGSAITAYGGVWAIDMDTKAMRLVNKLSYGTYAGYSSAMISIISPPGTNNPGGTGLYIGWDSGASTYGLDQTVGTPYVNGETTIDSDYIPIGTVLQPTTNGTVEFKLSVPIVSGESIKVQYRQKLSDAFADISSTTLFTYATSTTGGGTGWNGYAGVYQGVNFQNSQWVQFRAVLTSTASSPSYIRLTELRVR